MTGKGPLSTHVAWKSHGMQNKVIGFLKTINGILSFVEGDGADDDVVGYCVRQKVGQLIWNFNNKYKNYGFWHEGTVRKSGCVKGIYYRFKEVMDLIGQQWSKANEGVAIAVDTDFSTLNPTFGDV